MALEFFIALLSLCFLAWTAFFLIQKKVAHVTKSHIHILGEKNQKLILTESLFMVRTLYFMVLLTTTVASFYFLLKF